MCILQLMLDTYRSRCGNPLKRFDRIPHRENPDCSSQAGLNVLLSEGNTRCEKISSDHGPLYVQQCTNCCYTARHVIVVYIKRQDLFTRNVKVSVQFHVANDDGIYAGVRLDSRHITVPVTMDTIINFLKGTLTSRVNRP